MIGTLLELTSCEILANIEDGGIKLFMGPAVFITVFLNTTALVGCSISIGFAIISSTLIKFQNQAAMKIPVKEEHKPKAQIPPPHSNETRTCGVNDNDTAEQRRIKQRQCVRGRYYKNLSRSREK